MIDNNGKMMLTFGIDYDGTYNADPDLFKDIIKLIKSKGHKVVIVTGRSECTGQEIKNEMINVAPIVFAGDTWKKNAALAMGYEIDVWVDDLPESISHQYAPAKLDFAKLMQTNKKNKEEEEEIKKRN